jgi:1,4-alpha-glucan branching enzyme/maltooligosyltrehalose trehalohydrolase
MNEVLFGPSLTSDGVVFRLWAPAAKSVDLVMETSHSMSRDETGMFQTTLSNAEAGSRYRFRIDGELDVPDPASHFQPEDISGPSEVIDHLGYRWQAADWKGRPWDEAVFMETHVGAFTPEGTYRAMIAKLDHLVDTGITAIELMPVADFPGRWNWGYDGVLWYAPDSAYGRPDDLKTLIDEAHLRGLMVFLDVVYNHFGPEGNYLGRYAPQFFSETHTPWGHAINYADTTVREFAIQNALHWLRDYRFDGLRLDAVHAIVDNAPFLHELSAAVGTLASQTGRHIHLVLENDDNASGLLDPLTEPPSGQYRAQWNDDYHHVWHVLLSGEQHGYYTDYAHPLKQLARALSSGFVYQGEPSPHRDNQLRGETSAHLPPLAFVNFLQNHDQIGNRAFGDRLEANAPSAAIEAALAITLLAPIPPMLFMGEEWGSVAPFPFFCDFHGDLAQAVRDGRRREFSEAYAKHGNDVPDPLAKSTFDLAKIDWNDLTRQTARRRIELVRSLLSIRHERIIPLLRRIRFGDADAGQDGHLTVSWHLGDDQVLRLEANLSNNSRDTKFTEQQGRLIWGDTGGLSPWAVRWTIGGP